MSGARRAFVSDSLDVLVSNARVLLFPCPHVGAQGGNSPSDFFVADSSCF